MTEEPSFETDAPRPNFTDADRSRHAAQSEAQAWLAAIVENSDDAILSKTLEGVITTWNAGAIRLFGYSAEEAVGRPVTMLIPVDRLSEEDLILGRLRAGDRVDHFETVRRHKDGSLLDVSLTISPVRNRAGEIIGASKIARDITELKQSRQGQSILLREMNHRIKNVFSLIGSLVTLSARAAKDEGGLAATILARLEALARAHELTLPDLHDESASERSTTVTALLEGIVAPHRHGDDQRVVISGGDVPLAGTALSSIALLFHELTTNAAKYGALSSHDGRLSVTARIADDRLIIDWVEQGGPAILHQPASKGFGSMLEAATLRGLRGTVDREWKAGGLRLQLCFPVDRLGA